MLRNAIAFLRELKIHRQCELRQSSVYICHKPRTFLVHVKSCISQQLLDNKKLTFFNIEIRAQMTQTQPFREVIGERNNKKAAA